MSLHTWCRQGPRKPSSCATFMLNSHWGRAATGKKVLRLCVQEQPCGLWPARLLSGRGFSRQDYCSVLANTGCHTLLEHCISCCPSCQHPLSTWFRQNPCNPSSCTTSKYGPHGQTQVLQGSPRSKHQWTTHIQRWKLKPRGSVAKKEDPKSSHQLYKLQIKSTQSTKQTLGLWNI